MRRVLTGYAVGYDQRHRRQAHLFQNCFKSILCQEEQCLLEPVRYIHLNPLRAGIVDDLRSLDGYPYCNHSRIMGRVQSHRQDTGYILRLFGEKISKARRRHNQFVSEGVSQGQRPELTGGGRIRSVGGWAKVKALREMGAYQKGDEPILGDGDFGEGVLAQAEENLERKFHLQAKGFDFDKVVDHVAELLGLQRAEVLASGKYKKVMAGCGNWVLARINCFEVRNNTTGRRHGGGPRGAIGQRLQFLHDLRSRNL